MITFQPLHLLTGFCSVWLIVAFHQVENVVEQCKATHKRGNYTGRVFKDQGFTSPTVDLIDSRIVINLFRCRDFCLEHRNCFALSYDNNLKECRIYNIFNVEGKVKEIQGTDIITIIPHRCKTTGPDYFGYGVADNPWGDFQSQYRAMQQITSELRQFSANEIHRTNRTTQDRMPFISSILTTRQSERPYIYGSTSTTTFTQYNHQASSEIPLPPERNLQNKYWKERTHYYRSEPYDTSMRFEKDQRGRSEERIIPVVIKGTVESRSQFEEVFVETESCHDEDIEVDRGSHQSPSVSMYSDSEWETESCENGKDIFVEIVSDDEDGIGCESSSTDDNDEDGSIEITEIMSDDGDFCIPFPYVPYTVKEVFTVDEYETDVNSNDNIYNNDDVTIEDVNDSCYPNAASPFEGEKVNDESGFSADNTTDYVTVKDTYEYPPVSNSSVEELIPSNFNEVADVNALEVEARHDQRNEDKSCAMASALWAAVYTLSIMLQPPVDGGWSAWISPDPVCNAAVCDILSHDEEKRNCANPEPDCGGKACDGDATQQIQCGEDQCLDLEEFLSKKERKEGKQVLYFNVQGRKVPLFIEVDENGNIWVTIQRRVDGSVNFYRGWQQYKYGFGNVSREFWLGNENIHVLTAHHHFNFLRVDISDGVNKAYANYSLFGVGDEKDKYRLTAKDYSGNAGNSLDYHDNMQFSTFDNDNDVHGSMQCAVEFHGAWWYRHCHHSHLNGLYGFVDKDGTAVSWYGWKNDHSQLTMTSMKLKFIETNMDAVHFENLGLSDMAMIN